MKTWRVLVVGDEPESLADVAGRIAGQEFIFEPHRDPLRALAQLQAHDSQFDLIILDRRIADLDGIALLRQIKADGRVRHAPVIMQTTAPAAADIAQGISAGAYYYLTKPYQPQALVVVLRAAVRDIEARRRKSSLDELLVSRSAALRSLKQGEFCISTLTDAHHLAELLASLCPEPDAAAIGLSELLINAIEHGNLEIGYAEKLKLSMRGDWADEVNRRLALPEYRDRTVVVGVEREKQEIRFTITDHGRGFCWQDFLEIDPARAFHPIGRGIAMARQLSFTNLEYRDGGRTVTATVAGHDRGQATIR